MVPVGGMVTAGGGIQQQASAVGTGVVTLNAGGGMYDHRSVSRELQTCPLIINPVGITEVPGGRVGVTRCASFRQTLDT